MKAIVQHAYGSANVLKPEDIPTPAPKDDQVLIKVHAAALNPLDWRMMKGVPFVFRKMMKLRQPTPAHPVGIGRDVAGVVEAVGKNVAHFQAGDEVFGTCEASVAEYACAKESALVNKPAEVTFEQAAATPVAGLTALQGLRDRAKLQTGQAVLINGASGGVGTFAVQLAKHLGAHVTGACSTRNVELVKSIGADAVIDYTQSDFTKGEKRYDFIFECVGSKTFAECRPVLQPAGRFVGIGAPHDVSMIEIASSMIKNAALSLAGSQKASTFIAKSSQADLTLLGELIATGKIAPVIDRRYALPETAEAIRYLEQGHARGKVVIAVSS